MTGLQEIYLVSSTLGFVYIICSALLGHFLSGHHSGNSTDTAHHAGQGESGNIHTSSAHHSVDTNNNTHHNISETSKLFKSSGYGKVLEHGHVASDHGLNTGSHAHHHSQINSSDTNDNHLALSQSSGFRHKNINTVPSLYLKILEIISPTKFSFFLFLFGAIGFVCEKIISGYWTLAPSLIIGWFLANAFFKFFGNLLTKIGTSTNFSEESLLGSIGELTLSIAPEELGEVIVTIHKTRYTKPAKAYRPEEKISNLSKVIVVDIQDGVLLVEPFVDEIESHKS